MLHDISNFLAIYGVFAIGFSLAFHILIGQSVESMRSWERAFFATYRMIFGDFDWDAIEGTQRYFAMGLLFVHLSVSAILMLNLLIAMLNKSYADIVEKSTQEYLLERATLILNYATLNPIKKQGMEKDSEDLENKGDEKKEQMLLLENLPTSSEAIAKKLFSSFDSKKNGLDQVLFEEFLTTFLVEFCNFSGKHLIKGQIKQLRDEAVSDLKVSTQKITFALFLKWWSAKEESLHNEDQTEDVVSDNEDLFGKTLDKDPKDPDPNLVKIDQ